MKTTIKTSLLVAMGLTVSSAMAIPPPDKTIICESNPKYVKFVWNASAIDDQYRKCSQPYDPSVCHGAAFQTITAHEFMMSCPHSQVYTINNEGVVGDGPGGVNGEGPGNTSEIRRRGTVDRDHRFDPGSLNPGQAPQPQPTRNRELANPKLDKRE